MTKIQLYAQTLPPFLPTLLTAGALKSLAALFTFLGVTIPCAKLLALPRLSRIWASASSRLMVGLSASPGAAEGGVRSARIARAAGGARGMRVVVEMVWK